MLKARKEVLAGCRVLRVASSRADCLALEQTDLPASTSCRPSPAAVQMVRWQQQALQSAAVERTALLRSMDAFSEAVMLCDTSQPSWPLLYTNKAFTEATGASLEGAGSLEGFCSLCTFEHVTSESLPGAAELADPLPPGADSPASVQTGAQAAAQAAADKQQVFRARAVLHASSHAQEQPGGEQGATLELVFKPAGTSEQLRADQPAIGIPSFIGNTEVGSDAFGYYFGILQRLPAGLPGEPCAAKCLAVRTSGSSTPTNRLPPGTPTGADGYAAAGSAGSSERAGSEGEGDARKASALGPRASAAAPAAAAGAPAPVVPEFFLLRPEVSWQLWQGGCSACIVGCYRHLVSASWECMQAGNGQLRGHMLLSLVE